MDVDLPEYTPLGEETTSDAKKPDAKKQQSQLKLKPSKISPWLIVFYIAQLLLALALITGALYLLSKLIAGPLFYQQLDQALEALPYEHSRFQYLVAYLGTFLAYLPSLFDSPNPPARDSILNFVKPQQGGGSRVQNFASLVKTIKGTKRLQEAKRKIAQLNLAR